MKSARKDWMFLGVCWVLFTVIGEVMAFKAKLLPGMYAQESEVGDDAYKLLIKLAVPIFAGVCAALLTILVRQVDKKTSDHVETEDGPHILGHKKLEHTWIGVSAVLAIGLAINPGFVGLRDMRGESRADVIVKVQAQREHRLKHRDGRLHMGKAIFFRPVAPAIQLKALGARQGYVLMPAHLPIGSGGFVK